MEYWVKQNKTLKLNNRKGGEIMGDKNPKKAPKKKKTTEKAPVQASAATPTGAGKKKQI